MSFADFFQRDHQGRFAPATEDEFGEAQAVLEEYIREAAEAGKINGWGYEQELKRSCNVMRQNYID